KQTQPSGQAQKPSGLHKTGKTEKNVTSATIPKALKDRLPQHSCLANLRAHSATASGAPPSLCRYIDPTSKTVNSVFEDIMKNVTGPPPRPFTFVKLQHLSVASKLKCDRGGHKHARFPP
ncbi:hypothetical protein, partial [Phyllobacterium sophorae]|uniref:hypothetical protein n=1 Tax=Phyllobacterium sophorae TaxID=1520277 RepID=UPI001AECB84D